MKSVKITDKLWEELQQLKIKGRKKSLGQVIQELYDAFLHKENIEAKKE